MLDEGRNVDINRIMGTNQAGTVHSYAMGAGGAGAVGSRWSDSLSAVGAQTHESQTWVKPANGGPIYPAGTNYQQDAANTLCIRSLPVRATWLIPAASKLSEAHHVQLSNR